MKRFSLLYLAIFLFASCEQPIEYRDKIIYEEVEIEVVEVREVEVEKEVTITEYVDNIIQTTEIEYVEKEIYIMSEEEIPSVEPIQEYDNYVTLDNKVMGVTELGFEEIPNVMELFKIDGVIYFTIDGVGYSQKDGAITEIEESDFPTVPESDHIVYENSIFKIQQYVYNDILTSRVYKHVSENVNPVTAYMQIDSACMRGNDLLYAVSVDYPNRPMGVYLWTVNGNPMRLFEDGRIW